MSPEQLASEIEGRQRDALMTRAERAAFWEKRSANGMLADMLSSRVLSHGRVHLAGGYPGTLVYEFETTWDRWLSRASDA